MIYFDVQKARVYAAIAMVVRVVVCSTIGDDKSEDQY